jgi:hypothetical protein
VTIDTVAKVGGIFALLVMTHFVADWVFQSHAEAMAKPKNPWVRARHCFHYTWICCAVIALTITWSWRQAAWTAGILFFSHFLEDTYLPVYVWARYIRKPPEMFPSPHVTQNQGTLVLQGHDYKITISAPPPGMKEFVAFANTPLGKILLIAIDQIVHLLFLLPIAAMIVNPSLTSWLGWVGLAMTFSLAAVASFGQLKIHESKNPR